MGPSFVHYVCCLVVLVGFSLGILGLIIVAYGTLGGKSAVMVLRLGHVRLLLFGFWMSFLFFLGIQLHLVLVWLQGPCLFGITLRVFARRIPTWRLPGNGSVASFLASGELVRGYRKTPAHLARQGISGGPVASQGLEETQGSSGF